MSLQVSVQQRTVYIELADQTRFLFIGTAVRVGSDTPVGRVRAFPAKLLGFSQSYIHDFARELRSRIVDPGLDDVTNLCGQDWELSRASAPVRKARARLVNLLSKSGRGGSR